MNTKTAWGLKNMNDIPKIAELPIIVPQEVIDACLAVNTYCNNLPVPLTGVNPSEWNHATHVSMHYIQWVTDDFLREKNLEHVLNLDYITKAKIIEDNALAQCWLLDNKDISTIKSFINSYFDTAFSFSINTLSGSELKDYNGHPWPRIFIPLLNSECKYVIIEKNKRESLYFKVGHCYIWDVRYHHAVFNMGNTDRVIARFFIDPSKESFFKNKWCLAGRP